MIHVIAWFMLITAAQVGAWTIVQLVKLYLAGKRAPKPLHRAPQPVEAEPKRHLRLVA